ncbi:MAG: cytochrome b N-terminal domain-containing protein [Betaproteobacteria bacterium]|nr:cytochrome b N-terminal domain-containing protein [Betaproteobacteria bacterium]
MKAASLSLPRPGRAALVVERVDALFDRAFGQRLNPWRHLGALGFLFFWICCASGIWIYVGYDTSTLGAHESLAAMDRNEWPLGALARALHRYSADALVVVTALHLARELARRHYAAFRLYAWLTGLVVLVLMFAAGIGGYWLPWDQLAQWSLTATTEWFDALPVFDGALSRNVIAGSQVNDRFFSLLIFLHIGLPLAMLGAMWAHVQRVSPARTNPPGALGWGSLAMLAALCLAKPVSLMPAADLAFLPARIPVDWFYLFPHPLMAWLGPDGLWWATAAFLAGLATLPWATRVARAPAARVSLANCNGCARCFADCPYDAVVMVARTDARPHPRQAQVNPDLCAGCGICTGACPSSTPFRRDEALVTGIDMPSMAIGEMRDRLEARTAALVGRPRIVVFGCRWGADSESLAGPSTAAIEFVCGAMLPPSFVEYALRAGADGVLVASCREGDCEFRTGDQLIAARLGAERKPALRSSVARERVRLVPAGRTDTGFLRTQLDAFRADLERLESRHASPPKRQEKHHG